MKFKPTKEKLIEWKDAGLSFAEMGQICDYSKSSINRFFHEYKLEPPKTGRKKGFKVSEETRRKMSEVVE
jgi:hypothetical protein